MVSCPSLRGCYSRGETVEKALKKLSATALSEQSPRMMQPHRRARPRDAQGGLARRHDAVALRAHRVPREARGPNTAARDKFAALPRRPGPACPLALTGRWLRPHGGRRFGRRPRRRRPARWRSSASHRHRARPRCRARDPRPPLAGAGPRPADRPRPPAWLAPRLPGNPLPGAQAGLSRSAQSTPRSTATTARAAVCAAHATLDDPLSREQDRRRSRIRVGRFRLQGGLWGRRLDDAEVFHGSWIPAVWGRVMRTGV